jgi:gluconolactonase
MVTDIVLPGNDWELVGQGYEFTEGTAANAAGEVFFQDIKKSITYKVGLMGNYLPSNQMIKKKAEPVLVLMEKDTL